MRPPYISRTITSRPFWSAPSRYCPCSPGPIGVPSGATTFVGCPSISTLSVMWFSFGPVCATCSAHSGAARQNSTMSTNTPPQTSATLLRRSRSHARYQGLRPWICDAGTPVGSGGSPGTSSSPMGATIVGYLIANDE